MTVPKSRRRQSMKTPKNRQPKIPVVRLQLTTKKRKNYLQVQLPPSRSQRLRNPRLRLSLMRNQLKPMLSLRKRKKRQPLAPMEIRLKTNLKKKKKSNQHLILINQIMPRRRTKVRMLTRQNKKRSQALILSLSLRPLTPLRAPRLPLQLQLLRILMMESK